MPRIIVDAGHFVYESAAVLDTIVFFGALCVVEAVESTDQITGDAADALETDVILMATAIRAGVADYAVVTAHRIAVDGVVDRSVTDSGFLH